MPVYGRLFESLMWSEFGPGLNPAPESGWPIRVAHARQRSWGGVDARVIA